MEAHAIANEKPFSHTMEVFDGLLRKLEGPEWAALPHGQVEQALRVEGWELLRAAGDVRGSSELARAGAARDAGGRQRR